MWDILGNIQKFFNGNQGGQLPYDANKKLNFGVALDTSKNMPKNPNSYNDYVEKARQTGVDAAEFVLKPVTYTIGELDKKSNGNLVKALMAGTGNVRSNYAFINDIARKNAGMGLMATLGVVGGGIAGGVGGFAVGLLAGGVGAVPGAIAGFGVGSGIAGKVERSLAKSGTFDALDKTIKTSAKLSETAVGQEKYNFGRDVVHAASNVSGWKTLGDTSKGIGALTSGLINFGFEVSVAPDIKGVKLGGVAVKGVRSGGIQAKISGPVESALAKLTNEEGRQAKRIEADIALHKKTAAGEETAYSPLYKFNQENNVVTVQQHSSFKGNEFGQIGSALLAGKDFQTQSLVYRVGRGDKDAIAELEAKSPGTHAEIQRYEGAIEFVENAGSQKAVLNFYSTAQNKNLPLSAKNAANKKIVEEELKALRAEKSWLDNTLKLTDALPTDKTVSKFKWFENQKADAAKQRVALGLEQGSAKLFAKELNNKALDITTRETMRGKVIQSFYQKNGISAVVRFVHRTFDDAPHQTVNYNDVLQSNGRVRTTARMAVRKQVFTPEEALKFADDFARLTNEGEKNLLIESFTEKAISNLADKYKIPKNLKDDIVAQHLKMTRENVAKAKESSSKNEAYFFDDTTGSGEIIHDPQLVSQLANGGYLPDIELIDKAMKRWTKKKGAEASLPINTLYLGTSALDEFQSIWRTFTLGRIGFPINIIRDSTLRAYGDGVLFAMTKELSKDALEMMSNGNNAISKIKRVTAARLNPNQNLKKLRAEVEYYEKIIASSEELLKDAGYDFAKPSKNVSAEVQKQLYYVQKAKTELDAIRGVRDALESKVPAKVVSRKPLTVKGIEGFQRYDGGVQGQIMVEKIRGKDTMRGLISSNRELGMANIRRDRDGGHSVVARENEDLHMTSWINALTNQLSQDIVARKIMAGKMSEKDIVNWIGSHESGTYLERFGFVKDKGRNLRTSDAQYVYNRVLTVVNKIAPDPTLHPLILEGKVTSKILKEMYPDLATRPTIITDLTKDILGQSTFVQSMEKTLKNGVAWLATVPTSKLSYNPYFNVKYQQKLQNMVAMANIQGRRLTEKDQRQFESVARAHALNELRGKINAFSRDMNYHSAVNYLIAFFPAIVEQYRAYGKIMLDHPEFPYKIATISQIPDYIGNVQIDAFGDEYIPVDLPLLGMQGRLPTSWFNAINPTGGQLLSPGPLGGVVINELSKSINFEGKIADLLLPFGTTANHFAPLTPNTLRRGGQAWQAYFTKNGDQFNKDINILLQKEHFDFVQENDRQPTGSDLATMYSTSKDNAISLSFLRALGAGILPLQPKYVTPLQVYSDLFSKYTKEFGSEGTERFLNDYPDYFMITNSLSDSTSGIRPNDTAVALVKKNGKVIENIIADMGENANLSALGAIFNDENYAFSSSAQAYLVSKSIPGTRQKFKEQGAALDNSRSSIVNKGWSDYTKMVEIVSDELAKANYDPGSGYGLAVLTQYKDAFTEQMQTQNNLWYEEKQGAGFQKKLVDTVSAITTAVNTPELWQELSKQDRWHTIVEYMNFRYDVHDILKYRGTSITSDKAVDIRLAAEAKVAELRKQNIEFGKFYDRYFSNDDFSSIVEEPFGGK